MMQKKRREYGLPYNNTFTLFSLCEKEENYNLFQTAPEILNRGVCAMYHTSNSYPEEEMFVLCLVLFSLTD